MTVEVFEREIGGRTLSLEVGKVAGLANGAVTMRYGDTVILVTAVMSAEPREVIDFFPLTVDYEERLYAAGKIPGGWFRREGRPSTAGILTARLTDPTPTYSPSLGRPQRSRYLIFRSAGRSRERAWRTSMGSTWSILRSPN